MEIYQQDVVCRTQRWLLLIETDVWEGIYLLNMCGGLYNRGCVKLQNSEGPAYEYLESVCGF